MADDDDLVLSPQALAALNEVLLYRQLAAAEELQSTGDSNTNFEENWGLSQFWYSDQTAMQLAKCCIDEALRRRTDPTRRAVIACLSTPSICRQIKLLQPSHVDVVLFEFDRRFSAWATLKPEEEAARGGCVCSFVDWDFNEVKSLLTDPTVAHLREACDVITIDPPYLNEDCFAKFALLARFLSHQQQDRDSSERTSSDSSLIVLSSSSIQDVIMKLLPEVSLVENWRPQHAHNLRNEFCCYTNVKPLNF